MGADGGRGNFLATNFSPPQTSKKHSLGASFPLSVQNVSIMLSVNYTVPHKFGSLS